MLFGPKARTHIASKSCILPAYLAPVTDGISELELETLKHLLKLIGRERDSLDHYF